MKENKFKAWDKKKKEWATDIWVLIEIGKPCPWLVDGDGKVNEAKDIILVQHTGLKDKNGKEIYEGDVVQMRGLIAGHFEPMVGYVYYESPSFVVIAIEPRDVRGKDRLLDERNLNEIIGNIHENPELLKSQKEET